MQDDLFEILFTQPNATKKSIDTYVASLGSNTTNRTFVYSMEGNFSNPPSEQTGATVLAAEGGFSFIDSIRMISAFIITLWRIATMPIALFSYNLLPPIAAAIIGIPLFILNITTLIVLIRGGGAV